MVARSHGFVRAASGPDRSGDGLLDGAGRKAFGLSDDRTDFLDVVRDLDEKMSMYFRDRDGKHSVFSCKKVGDERSPEQWPKIPRQVNFGTGSADAVAMQSVVLAPWRRTAVIAGGMGAVATIAKTSGIPMQPGRVRVDDDVSPSIPGRGHLRILMPVCFRGNPHAGSKRSGTPRSAGPASQCAAIRAWRRGAARSTAPAWGIIVVKAQLITWNCHGLRMGTSGDRRVDRLIRQKVFAGAQICLNNLGFPKLQACQVPVTDAGAFLRDYFPWGSTGSKFHLARDAVARATTRHNVVGVISASGATRNDMILR